MTSGAPAFMSGPGESAVGVESSVRATSSSGGLAPGRADLEERLLRDVTEAVHRVRSPRHHAGVGALIRALRVGREAGVPELRIRVASARGRERAHQDELEDLVERARAQELARYSETWIG